MSKDERNENPYNRPQTGIPIYGDGMGGEIMTQKQDEKEFEELYHTKVWAKVPARFASDMRPVLKYFFMESRRLLWEEVAKINLPEVTNALVDNAANNLVKESPLAYSGVSRGILIDVRIILQYAKKVYQTWLREELNYPHELLREKEDGKND